MPQRNIHDVLAAGRVRLSAARDRITAAVDGNPHLSATRDRVTTGLAGRSRQVTAIAALAAVTSVGLTAAAVDNPRPASADTVAVADRAATADRPDRAERDSKDSKTTEDAKAKQTKAKSSKKKKSPKWVSPMPGANTTSCYGQRWGVLHAGIDLAAPAGTPIQSVGKGKVVAAGWAYTGYGISVVVDHGNGYLTHYAHMSKKKVKVGEKVKPGEVLGLEGSTGDSTGPHLHFEVHKGSMWNQINPDKWLDKRDVKHGC